MIISPATHEGQARNIDLVPIPDTCPICHFKIHPVYLFAFRIPAMNRVQVVFRCTRAECINLFISTYDETDILSENAFISNYVCSAPISYIEVELPEIIKQVSPTFIEIYNQALAAESHLLTELVGIGLRKALEFLIKDFAKTQNPDKVEEIEESYLGKCIEDYIDDTNINNCAKRAIWLGNDETHYIRKWEDKDIHDLKTLTKLTMNWIENVILTSKYIEEMEDKDKTKG